jgi:hypothetical protein
MTNRELIPSFNDIFKFMIRPYGRQAAAEQAEQPKDAAGQGFEAVVPNPKLKLMDQVREVMRFEVVEG